MAGNKAKVAGFVLQERDRLILFVVTVLGAVEGRLLAALFFGSIGRSNFRIGQLVAARYLQRYDVPTAPKYSRACYMLGPASTPIIDGVLAVHGIEPEPEEFERILRKVPLSRLAHALAVGRIFGAIWRSTASVDTVGMDLWLPEPMLWTRFEVPGSRHRQRAHCFAPDAFARIAFNGIDAPLNMFVECDTGVVNDADFSAKLVAWGHFVELGLADDAFGDGAHFLVIVAPTAKRADRLCRLATRLRTPHVAAATFDALDAGALGKAYRTADSSTPLDANGLVDQWRQR